MSNRYDGLRWFVQWSKEYKGWEVMLGEFRDSYYTDKYLAEERRDELNKEDKLSLPGAENERRSGS